jgi:hypothetical protein
MSDSGAKKLYSESLQLLNKIGLPFLVGGTVAVNSYIEDLNRPTKDMDIFCKAADYPKILQEFKNKGFQTEVEDERWLAKVSKGKYFVDIIFALANMMAPVPEAWFKESSVGKLFDQKVKVLSVTELVLSKMFIQDRNKYEGSDVAHLFLLKNKEINWKRLLDYMDQFWEVLLIHVLNFRFIYPSERELIPRWLLDELLNRLKIQMDTPTSKVKVCRGKIFSAHDYAIDVEKWGFADVIGKATHQINGK